MKIVDVKTYSPVYPVKEPFSNGMRTTRERAYGIVEVITDAGITGWGEGASLPPRRAIDNNVVGRNPFDYEVIWSALHYAGVDAAGISGIDIALWDIMGKASKQPVHALLGGAFRNERRIHVSDVSEMSGAMVFYSSLSWFIKAGRRDAFERDNLTQGIARLHVAWACLFRGETVRAWFHALRARQFLNARGIAAPNGGQ